MICVTGANGTLSSEIIRQLESAKAPFRGAYFSNKKAEAARSREIEAVIIDYNRAETLRAAFQGCDELFLLGPNALNQSELKRNAVEAAKAAGVRHIVQQSVLGADEESYSLAKIHRSVEKAIVAPATSTISSNQAVASVSVLSVSTITATAVTISGGSPKIVRKSVTKSRCSVIHSPLRSSPLSTTMVAMLLAYGFG